MSPQSGDVCLEEVMKYEISQNPPSVFEGSNILRKHDKAPRVHAVRSHATSSNDAIPKTDHYVIDGCSLIQRLKWTDGSTYNSIAGASFTVAMLACKSTTITGENNGMLVLLLYHAATNDCKDISFRSDKGKQNVYIITVL